MKSVPKPIEAENQHIKRLDRLRVALQMAAFSFVPLIISGILASIFDDADIRKSIGVAIGFGGLLFFLPTLFISWLLLTIFVSTKSQLRKFRYILMILILVIILGMYIAGEL